MFFLASKLLQYFTQPLFVGTLMITASFFITNRRWKKLLLMIPLLTLFLLSNGVVVSELYRLWSVKPIRIEELDTPYEAAIILGGTVGTQAEPHDRIFFNGEVNRLLLPLSLYRKGKVKKLVLCGGSGYVIGNERKESALVKQYLLEAGVPGEDIILESSSRNTHENAIFIKPLLEEHFSGNARFLLCTSGWHLPRALGCFRQEGVPVQPFSSDPLIKRNYTPDSFLVPSPGALEASHRLIREWVGMLAYRVMGYV